MKAAQTRSSGLPVAFFLAVALLIAGCEAPPQSPPQPPAKPLFGVLIYKKDDIYISSVTAALKKALEERGTVVLLYANENQITQNDQFHELLAAKSAGIAVNIVDTQAAASFVDKAKKVAIPLVFFNREPDLDVLKRYDKTCFVGTVVEAAGRMQGDLIAEILREHPEYDRNNDGKFQYVMLQGNADNAEALARTEYSVKQAEKRGVKMQQISAAHVCNWDRDLARRALEMELAVHEKSIELIIANNDAMALGAIDALAAHGYNKEGGAPEKFIPVVGVDAVAEAVEAIRKGVMSATVKQDGKAMGEAAAALLMNIADKKGPLERTPYVWDASGVAVRIPYLPHNRQTE